MIPLSLLRVRRLAGAAVLVTALAPPLVASAVAAPAEPLPAGEARRRFERLCQIRRDKFDLVLPEAMRGNGIQMWIVPIREGHPDPLYEDLGRGYAMGTGYYVFTDRGGGRVERAALGIDAWGAERCGYDLVKEEADLRAFVAERDPQQIGVNMSEQIGAADGLSHVGWRKLGETLGEPWASRLVSAERLVSDFRSRRVAGEIVAFGEAGEISRTLAERALSNEVVTPGATTLDDVAWWLQDQLLAQGFGSSFDMPSVYVIGPKGIEEVSTSRIIQRGDLLVIDWGVCRLNLCTDVKRMAYVLKPGEVRPPQGIQNAFDVALEVRRVVRAAIEPGRTGTELQAQINRRLEEAGYAVMAEFNKPTATPKTEVITGCHSVGNGGHGEGPSIGWFQPLQMTFEVRPTTLLSIELFAWTPAPEWGGKKVRVPLEDDAVVTPRGVEWLYPPNDRLLLIK